MTGPLDDAQVGEIEARLAAVGPCDIWPRQDIDREGTCDGCAENKHLVAAYDDPEGKSEPWLCAECAAESDFLDNARTDVAALLADRAAFAARLAEVEGERDAAIGAPTCSTCGGGDNPVCSNPWHLFTLRGQAARAEQAEAAVARVEALADELDVLAAKWPYAHWSETHKQNATSIRAALRGEAGEVCGDHPAPCNHDPAHDRVAGGAS